MQISAGQSYWLLVIAGLSISWSAPAASCEALAQVSIANTTIISAALVSSSGASPEYCKVFAVTKPVADSEIRSEIWLPSAQQWNGKFLGTGNGGYSGAIGYNDMRLALARGYATGGSNTGHDGGDLKFGEGHPEKIADWAYRAVHVMTGTAKLLVRDYYDRAPQHSYFKGCSTGGHQALMEAQRFPADYDGIVAGDPGNDRIRLNIGFLWSWLAAGADKAHPLPASKLPMLNRAVVEACDSLDGVQDGIISEPRKCRFDPASLLCKNGDAPTCLTESQVAAVKKIYDGARNPRTNQPIFPGWERGSESPDGRAGWQAYFVGQPEPARLDFWRSWLFDNPAWDPHSFDFDNDVAAADTKLGFIDARNPDLSAFEKQGGKIVMYHGWADPVVPPEDGIEYYEGVASRMGGEQKIAGFFRLFMVPGMAHCTGGPGPSSFDAVEALNRWVDGKAAPERIIATHSTNGVVDRSRPLCAYPAVAKWNGKGSSDDAANFDCRR